MHTQACIFKSTCSFSVSKLFCAHKILRANQTHFYPSWSKPKCGALHAQIVCGQTAAKLETPLKIAVSFVETQKTVFYHTS